MQRLPCAVVLLAGGALLGCNTVWGIEAGVPAANDVKVVAPCVATPGLATVCLTLKALKHPPYDAASGATALGLDGKGVFTILAFGEDPTISPGTATPIATFRHPDDGTEAHIDTPIQLALTVPARQVWFDVSFEDTPRPAGDLASDFRPGSFSSTTTSTTGGESAPTTVAVDSGLAKLVVSLEPVRELDVTVTSAPTLKTTYASFAVPGDGRVGTYFFSGPSLAKGDFVAIRFGDCVEAQPLAPSPPTFRVRVPTIRRGPLKFAVTIDDYGTDAAYPARGMIASPTGADAPTFEFTDATWSVARSVQLTSVVDPFKPGEATDPQQCR